MESSSGDPNPTPSANPVLRTDARAGGSPIDPRCDPDAPDQAAGAASAASTAAAAATSAAASSADAARPATTVVYTTTTTVQHATADEHEQWLDALEDVALNQSNSFV